MKSHSGRGVPSPQHSRQQQTALPESVNTVYGPPSSAIGHSEGPPPIGVAPKAGNARPVLITNQQHRMVSFSMTAGPRAKTLTGANPNRKYLLIQNNSAVTIYVGFGTVPGITGNNAVRFPPNKGITFEGGICPNNEVNVIAPVAADVSVVEGTAK